MNIRLTVIEGNMGTKVSGLGTLGHGAMGVFPICPSLKNPEWLKGNEMMQEWCSENRVLVLTMLSTCCGNLGTCLSGSGSQFPSLC